MQVSQHSTLTLLKGEAVSALSYTGNYDLCSIAMRVFRVRATRRTRKADSNSFTPTPRVPGGGPYEDAKGMCKKTTPSS